MPRVFVSRAFASRASVPGVVAKVMAGLFAAVLLAGCADSEPADGVSFDPGVPVAYTLEIVESGEVTRVAVGDDGRGWYQNGEVEAVVDGDGVSVRLAGGAWERVGHDEAAVLIKLPVTAKVRGTWWSLSGVPQAHAGEDREVRDGAVVKATGSGANGTRFVTVTVRDGRAVRLDENGRSTRIRYDADIPQVTAGSGTEASVAAGVERLVAWAGVLHAKAASVGADTRSRDVLREALVDGPPGIGVLVETPKGGAVVWDGKRPVDGWEQVLERPVYVELHGFGAVVCVRLSADGSVARGDVDGGEVPAVSSSWAVWRTACSGRARLERVVNPDGSALWRLDGELASWQ